LNENRLLTEGAELFSAHKTEVAVVFLVLFFFFWFFLRKKRPLGYKRVENIVTESERRFFFALQEAVGDRYYIFTKVRMADVLLPVSARDRSRWRSAFNKVACKHFDYVLCDADLRIVGAIELDDASHARADRQERDRFVEWACKSASFVLFRFPTQKRYDTKTIRRHILKALA
jgi:hypothetical protein